MTAEHLSTFTPPANPALVTGGAGFVGSHVVRQLLRARWRVRVLEKPGAATHHLPASVDVVRADVRDGAAVREAMRGCGTVFHLAANPNLWSHDPSEFDAINHHGTRRVLDAAMDENVERFVHVSTELVVQPDGPRDFLAAPGLRDASDAPGDYCASKRLGELAVREAALAGLPAVIVNPGVPVGPGDFQRGPFTRLIGQIMDGRIKALLDTNMALIGVSTLASAIVAAAVRGQVGRRYVLIAENWSMQQLLDAMHELTGRAMPTWRVPYGLALAFAFLEEQYCRVVDRVPMASVAGVRLSRRPPRDDAGRDLRELSAPMTPCRRELEECVKWIEAMRMARQRGAESPALSATGVRD